MKRKSIPRWATKLSRQLTEYRPKFFVGDIVLVKPKDYDVYEEAIGVIVECGQDVSRDEKYWEHPHYSIDFGDSISAWWYEDSMKLVKRF